MLLLLLLLFFFWGGAAKGSILGPDLWNVSYDGILRMETPPDTFLACYAEDITAVIVARNPRMHEEA